MRRLLYALLLPGFLTVLSLRTVEASQGPSAAIEWEGTSIDLGEIAYNKPVSAEFGFRNPGMIPLVITEVKPSCGCTVADFPKEPIMSGKEGMIKVTFDAKEEGYFAKTVTVYSNAEGGVTNLYIKGIVVR